MPSALQKAIENGDEQGWRGFLAAHGGNPDAVDEAGLSALHYAAYFGKLPMVEALLDLGADPDLRIAKYGSTPLQWATYCGIKTAPKLDHAANRPVIEALIRRGAAYDIMSAVANRDAGRVRALLAEDPASVNSRWMNGFAPLHVNPDPELGRILLSAGGDVNQRADDGTTPLMYLCNRLRAEPDLAALYLEHGADVNAQNRSGRTALHGAARRGHERIASMLLERGADPGLKNAKGETALDKAANLRKHSMRSLLQRPR